jgi:hypothetical protein
VADKPDPKPARSDKPDEAALAAAAIDHGIPSYEAWAMTPDELTDLAKKWEN